MRIATPYRKYLKWFYKTNPKIGQYDVMYKRLMDDRFLQPWGDYSIIPNDRYLQFAWVLENRKLVWGKQLILEQIKYYKPRVVIIQNPVRYNGKFIKKIKAIGVKKVIAHICSPFPKKFEVKFKTFDCVVTCNNSYANKLKSNGIKTKMILHSFNEKNLERLVNENCD